MSPAYLIVMILGLKIIIFELIVKVLDISYCFEAKSYDFWLVVKVIVKLSDGRLTHIV